MSEGKIRGKILVVLWTAEKPMTIQEIADKVGLNASSTMGYLLGLIKAKYVAVPQKHFYVITDLGKQAIGLPKVDNTMATKFLRTVPIEKAFHFYYAFDQPTGVYADNLKDFATKTQNIDMKSLEFHVPRKHFEHWIISLGDVELAKKMELIRIRQLTGETLRNEVQTAVKRRCEELENVTS